jgi:hypothetical protein
MTDQSPELREEGQWEQWEPWLRDQLLRRAEHDWPDMHFPPDWVEIAQFRDDRIERGYRPRHGTRELRLTTGELT